MAAFREPEPRTMSTPAIPVQSTIARLVCIHCGTPLDSRSPVPKHENEPAFCCLGCQAVYSILNSKGLGRYYEIKDLCVPIRKARPATLPDRDFQHLDHTDFLLQYTGSATPASIDFYLEGVHCVACLWLIEKLPTFVAGIRSAELDIGRSVARIGLEPGASLASIATEIDRLGYRPHPVRRDEDADTLLKKENRSWLIRIGVAAAGTLNIMLMTVPLYAGAEGQLGELFRWISGIVFLPVLGWSAQPFFKSAYASLRAFRISIDVPVMAAAIAGAAASFYGLFTHSPHIYFDSLSALIFLLLSSRYFLRRLQQSSLSSAHLAEFLTPSAAKKWNERQSTFESVPTATVRTGDRIEVGTGETIPADGTLNSVGGRIDQDAFISSALLTGEPFPVATRAGASVFSGTKNEGDTIIITVTAVSRETRLGSILKSVEEGRLQRANIVSAADRISRWFLGAVLVAAAGVVIYSPDLTSGFNRALALVIVTCPCALALATPLALSRWLARAAVSGLLIKNGDTIERLARIKTVLLDKTGTLTEGNFTVLEWKESQPQPEIRAQVLALEMRSRHPIAHALCRYLRTQGISPAPGLVNFTERFGIGVEGTFGGTVISIRAVPGAATQIGVFSNGTCVSTIALGDRLRPDSAQACTAIREMGIDVRIVSGDSQESVTDVGRALGFAEDKTTGCATPERKREIAERASHALMVGDGANDAVALAAAYSSAAVHGAMDVSLRISDAYLVSPGVMPVAALLTTGRETFRVIRRNLVFSIFYNLIGAGAALAGWVGPLFAAVLMPASAATVFLSSVWGTRKLRNLFTATDEPLPSQSDDNA